MHNPWNINSLYDLQYFNCPSCIFKNKSKQDFVNHAYEIHPESIEYLKKLNDKSILDIEFPLDEHISEIKIEENFINDSFDNYSNNKEIAIENEVIREIQKNDSFSEIEAEESIIDNQCDKDFEDPLHIEKNLVENIQDNQIKNEEVVHEEVNTKQCYYCKESFLQDGDLIRHISSVHKVININEIPAKNVKICTKFQCIRSKNCQKTFDSKEQLKKHFQMKHTNANAAPTICRICYIYFETSFQLEDHMKIKHNELKLEILN